MDSNTVKLREYPKGIVYQVSYQSNLMAQNKLGYAHYEQCIYICKCIGKNHMHD